MKTTAIQLNAYWPADRTFSELRPVVDSVLESFGFEVHQGSDTRGRVEIYGWKRVSLPPAKTWFSIREAVLKPSEVCMEMTVKPRRKSMVGRLEEMFGTVVRTLHPDECALVTSNADSYPVFAQNSKGGLTCCVNLDFDPDHAIHPGDPGWFREVGEELRFVSAQLLIKKSVDPHTFAVRSGRTCAPFAAGFLFDGEWHSRWHAASHQCVSEPSLRK